MTELIRWYVLRARYALLAASVAGLLSGVLGASLIALIGQGLGAATTAPHEVPTWLVWAGCALAACVAASEVLARWLHLRVNLARLNELREELAERILGTDLAQLERIGPAALCAALVDDLFTISHALGSLPTVAISLTVLLGSTTYLLWLSPLVLLSIAALVLLALSAVALFNRLGRRQFATYLGWRDRLLDDLIRLVHSVRELKSNAWRQESLIVERLRPTARAQVSADLSSQLYFAAGSALMQMVYSLAILMVFAFVARGIAPIEILASFALTAVFMKEHVGRLIACYPLWAQAVVARRKAEGLALVSADRARWLRESALGRTPEAGGETGRLAHRLQVRALRYRYPSDEPGEAFELGPLELDIGRPEIVFLSGENGGGKSTLAKLLCGLYVPDAGEIRLDGEPIGEHNRHRYRERFSTVFTDAVVFEALPVSVGALAPTRAADWLERLELQNKVRIVDGVLSTTKLSMGQRKRLAMLHALLEDRPLMIFDEWASTQDPRFKRFFYLELLPNLRDLGKWVLVITHDAEFAHCADRHLVMEHGVFCR